MKPLDPVNVHAGQRMRAARMARGLSQEDLGGRLGVSFQQIQKYEKGTNRFAGSRLTTAAQVLGVEVGYFFRDANGDAVENTASPDQLTMLAAARYGHELILALLTCTDVQRASVLQLIQTMKVSPDARHPS